MHDKMIPTISGLTLEEETYFLEELGRRITQYPEKNKLFKDDVLVRSVIRMNDGSYWVLGKKYLNNEKLDLKGKGHQGSATLGYQIDFKDNQPFLTGKVSIIKSIRLQYKQGMLDNEIIASRQYLNSRGHQVISAEERSINHRKNTSKDKIYLHLQFYDGLNYESMRNVLSTLSVGELLEELIDIAKGLREMHDQNILHLDLKPDNILRYKDEDNSRIHNKIIDMGSAYALNGIATRTLPHSGSPRYMDPQSLISWVLTRGKQTIVSKETDIYALGLTLKEIALYKNWQKEEVTRETWNIINVLCHLMTSFKKSARPQIDEVIFILEQIRTQTLEVEARAKKLNEPAKLLQELVYNQLILFNIQLLKLQFQEKSDNVAQKKKEAIKEIITQLKKDFDSLFNHYPAQQEEASKQYFDILSVFEETIKKHNSLLNKKRVTLGILAFNLLLCLTGIGLIILVIKAFRFYKQGKGEPVFFLPGKAKTLDLVEEGFENLKKLIS